MITLRQLHLQRGIKFLLHDANLSIYTQQKVGIVGANGCGKSSLFALFKGELHHDSGDFSFPSSWTIAHVAQETPAVEMSALEYTLLGDSELQEINQALAEAQEQHDGMREAELHARYDAIGGYTAQSRASQLLHGLGFSEAEIYQPVKTFSGGWRMRLNLAQALTCRSDLLLLDEPTNHLDLDAVLWFEQWLRQYQGTLLLISHDRDFLDNVVDHIVHIEQQQTNLYTGNYSDFENQRAERLAQQQALHEKQQREMAHMHKFVERFRYKASKAKQAQSRLKALEKMEVIQAAHIDSPFHFDFPAPEKVPQHLVNLEKMDIGYAADKPLLTNINLAIRAGTRMALLGANGAGKSTLIKLLANELAPLAGEYTASEHIHIGYFAQHQLEALHEDDSALLHLQRLDENASEQSLRNFLGGFAFFGDMADAPIAPFSGGEKARLALALLVYQRPNILLLDEPTNHLDLEMRHALTIALQSYTGALVLVSHDRHLLKTTTDQYLLVADGDVKPFEGDLDDYKTWLLAQRAAERSESRAADKEQKTSNAPQTAKSRAEQKRIEAEQRALRRPLKNKADKLEKQLEQLSEKKEAIEAQLADPSIYDDQDKLKKCLQEQATLSQQMTAIEEEWLDITEQLETMIETQQAG